MKKIFNKRTTMLWMLLTGISSTVFAADAPVPSEASKPIAMLLIVIIVALLLVIGVLAGVVMNVAKLHVKKQKALNANAAKAVMIVALGLSSFVATAQEKAAEVVAEPPTNYGGLSATSFWALFTVILICVAVIIGLLHNLRFLLKLEKASLAKTQGTHENTTAGSKVEEESSLQNWWDKFNSFRPMKEEVTIDLGHNYDGIRELDNKLPGWWLYGFYVTIIIGVIYLYRYHVANSAPLSIEELQIAMKAGEAEKNEYLKKSGSAVDETNVVLLTDAAALEEGKKTFIGTCAACHKADGGGSVGPNLTDDYWIHGGSVQDIFKTIKYGAQGTAMQAWKDQLSPVKIQQLTSFIKSIHGTKPAGALPPNGKLYEEKAATATTDTTKTKAKDSVTNVTKPAK